MAEYAQVALEKVIKEQKEKIDTMIYTLRLRRVQRERLEGEIIEIQGDIVKAEDFMKLMQQLQNDSEDRLICSGIKEQRKKKRGRTKRSKP